MPSRSRMAILISVLVAACLASLVLILLNEDFLVFEAKILPYGSRLIAHSYLPEKKMFPRVILLGNSVFQYTLLVEEIRRQRNALAGEQMFEVANFGAVGASLADYLFIYEHVRQYKPDLIVVHMTPHTLFSGEPLLRTDMKGTIFQPQYWRLASFEPIRRAYTRNEWAESLVYSFFPPYRFLPILRHQVKVWILGTGLRITDFFPWRLNGVEEWRTARAPETLRKLYENATEYSASEELLHALLERLKEDGTRALFVLQEREKPIYPAERRLIEWTRDDVRVRTLNLSQFFKPEELPDKIHFNPKGARQSAARILPAIESLLGRAALQSGPGAGQ